MMHPTLSAPPMIDSIAVTYRCSHGHHDIRFYKEATPLFVCWVPQLPVWPWAIAGGIILLRLLNSRDRRGPVV
jgi:hypothetical protein